MDRIATAKYASLNNKDIILTISLNRDNVKNNLKEFKLLFCWGYESFKFIIPEMEPKSMRRRYILSLHNCGQGNRIVYGSRMAINDWL